MRGSLTTTAANEGMDGAGMDGAGVEGIAAPDASDTLAAVAAAVRAGLAKRRKTPAPLAALRRDGLRAVRGDHGAAGVLPDAHRAGDPAGVVGRDRLRRGTAAGDRRAGRRLGDQDLSLARRRCWPGSRPRSTRRSTSRRRRCGWRSPSCDVFGACACGRSWRAIPTIWCSPSGRPSAGWSSFSARTSATTNRPRRARCWPACAHRLEPGDAFLLGADLAKSPRLLRPAYDDAAGVTARFNLNVLARLNRELGAAFDLDRFRHVVKWNAAASRMELYVESTVAQTVPIRALGTKVAFAPWRAHPHRVELQAHALGAAPAARRRRLQARSEVVRRAGMVRPLSARVPPRRRARVGAS